MKVPFSWLNELVELDQDINTLSDQLTFIGLEVESVETLGSEFDGVVAGVVTHVQQHPNADKLKLCLVAYGESEQMRVVCGAPNVMVGGVYPFAPVGTELPGGFTIKKAKIRGEESMGMLCAKDELGLGEDHSGLLELGSDVVAGTPFVEIWGAPETVIELEITPNRPDCLSMIGIAREIAALTNKPINLPKKTVSNSNTSSISANVCDAEDTPRYTLRVIDGVEIGPSPQWIQKRLEAIGIRPINNVVDITNYVMLETGHPLHAFDQGSINGNEISVRRAFPNEKIQTLDGVERSLDDSMLVIADSEKSIALAGVMGGANSEVKADTTSIILEAACFNATSIRSTAKKLGLHSESSYRFQRGVCVNSVGDASDRAVMLLMEFAGAKTSSSMIDNYENPQDEKIISVDWKRIAQRIGAPVSDEESKSILLKLGMEIIEDEGEAKVIPPPYRLDLDREIDLVEEVARIYGMERIPENIPQAKVVEGCNDLRFNSLRSLRNNLQGLGVSEIMNYTLVSDNLLDRFDESNKSLREKLPHPISEDQSVLRTSLIPQMVESLGRNYSRQINEACFYELGRVFNRENNNLIQSERISFGMMGPVGRGQLNKRRPLEAEEMFIWMKGLIHVLLNKQNLNDLIFKDLDNSYYEDGQALSVYHKDSCIGSFGLIKKSILELWKVNTSVAVGELELDALLSVVGQYSSVNEVPVYPSISRDLALIVDQGVTNDSVINIVAKLQPKNLESLELFDVYTGKGVDKGKKSVAYSFTYRSANQTLTDKKVNKVHQQVIDTLCKELVAEVRN
tara:strand:+ start:175 stop:2565 length:2391 start_codon:yes stop_codon:yes gene_type:complete